MYKLLSKTFLFLLVFLLDGQLMASIQIREVRMGVHPNKVRFVLDLSANLSQKPHTDTSGEMFQVRLPNTAPFSINKTIRKNHLLSYSMEDGIFTVKSVPGYHVADSKVFSLGRSNGKPHRLVIDVFIKKGKAKAKQKKDKKPKEPIRMSTAGPLTTIQVPSIKPTVRHHISKSTGQANDHLHAVMKWKYFIIIDPGHGGIDPGSIGKNGTKEKDVTLSVARTLKKELEKSPDFHVQLTRDDDVFMRQRERYAILQEQPANMLISLHADSSHKKHVKGISVYTLSDKASNREAELIAANENKAAIVEGMDIRRISANDEHVTNVLLDIKQRHTRNRSIDFTKILISEFEHNQTELVKNSHRQADLFILRATDVPSVLIELGYLSNEKDAQRLADKNYQNKLAKHIAKAVNNYLDAS
jgi:N-acetylmuramoyl-L-alanine amidase